LEQRSGAFERKERGRPEMSRNTSPLGITRELFGSRGVPKQDNNNEVNDSQPIIETSREMVLSASDIYNSMFFDYPDVVEIADLQTMLKIGRNTAYNLIRDNKIKSIRIGKIHKIPKVNTSRMLNGLPACVII
jgi:hypothetical protein